MKGAALGILLAAAGAARPLEAQLTATIEGGGSLLAYSGSKDVSALSLSPGLEWLAPSARLNAEGSFAQFSGGGWSVQGLASGSGFTPAWRSFRGEVTGTGIGSTRDDGIEAGEVLGRARLHWLDAREGVWLGGALGQAWNGIAWQTDRRADAGGWIRRSAVTLLATVDPTWLGDSLRFVDGDLTVRVARGSVELSGTAGTRWWSRPAGAAGSSWGGATAALWLGPHLALVAAGGSYLADYAQGLPSGSYISLGMRLASRRPPREEARGYDAALSRIGHPSDEGAGPRLPAPVVPAFQVGRADADRERFRLRAPEARSVELVGDFTEWQPVAFSLEHDGSWGLTLELAPGVYRMNLRVDGGAWGVPPGLPAITDDFGGVVGILRVVP